MIKFIAKTVAYYVSAALVGMAIGGLTIPAFPVLAANPVGQVGGITTEACTGRDGSVAMAVTASSAYTSGNIVGGKLKLFRALHEPRTGVVQSVRLTSKSAQTAEFDVTLFAGNPSNSTWTDKSAPAINAADVALAMAPIKLTIPYSGLGTHTVYGQDAIGRAVRIQDGEDLYAVITVVGTPTFTATTDLQLCVALLLD
jgi:hypothetical protein